MPCGPAATLTVLEPIFEADLEPTAYGYRPGRSGIDAVKAVHQLLCQGFTDVVDADLSKYFDTFRTTNSFVQSRRGSSTVVSCA
jgi:RNA-directed DNA polymerase